MSDDYYTIKLDHEDMTGAVVKFLVQCYEDERNSDDNDEILKSMLNVIRYCTTQSEYATVLERLGIE